jgi:methyl-accepting chemotaxis protein
MSIRLKLLIGFLLCTTVTAALGGYAVVTISSLGNLTMEVYDKPLMAINYARAAETNFTSLDGLLIRLSSDVQGEQAGKLKEGINDQTESLSENLEVASERAMNEESRVLIKEIQSLVTKWQASVETFISGKKPSASIDVSNVSSAILGKLGELVEITAAAGFEFRLRAEEEVAKRGRITLIVVAAGIALGILIALYLAVVITGPLKRAVKTAEAIADGKLDNEFLKVGKDETGKLLRSLDSMQQAISSRIEKENELQERDRRRQEEQQEVLQNQIGTLEQKLEAVIEGSVSSVVDNSTTLKELSDQMLSAASRLQERAGVAAQASEDTSSNVSMVTNGTERLNVSFADVSSKVKTSTEIAESAAQQSMDANKTMDRLAETANQIGSVAQLIKGIAEQTNLLALNATIEAARAGDAGKGFAVVATEVKNLAIETAKATEEIETQVQAMQSVTASAVSEMQNVTNTIKQIRDIASGVADSVAEQTAETGMMVENATKAEEASNKLSLSVSDVTDDVSSSEGMATRVNQVSHSVLQEISSLQNRLSETLNEAKSQVT